MVKDTTKELEDIILGRLNLSRQLSEEEIIGLIDEEIRKESKKRYLEIRERERIKTAVFRSIRQLGIL